MLENQAFAWTVGRHVKPLKYRPSMRVSIRSETLWAHGVQASIDRIEAITRAVGGVIDKSQLSRVDPCADLLLPDDVWRGDLGEHFATDAAQDDPHYVRRQLSGFTIGKGQLAGRLYDKPREIKEKSGKVWMYDVWGIEAVPTGHRVIRVEFQVLRESLRSFGLDVTSDLFTLMPNLWASLTRKWLRVVDDLAKHPTRRKAVPWWQVVQSAIPGAPQAQPLIRAKAISTDHQQLARQLLGHLTCIVALQLQGHLLQPGEEKGMARNRWSSYG